MIPIILSDGSGSRLWSLSRKQHSKRFFVLTGDDALFQRIIKRLALGGMQASLLVHDEERRFIVQEQLEAQNLASQTILLEPLGCNTTSAVTVAAVKLTAKGRDGLLLILPTDHVIEDQRAFQQALALATNAAEEGGMALFGISASRPETGYDCTRASADAQLPEDVSQMQSFVEKPDEARVREFVAVGGYHWNNGMFLFRTNHYLGEPKKHDVDIYDTCLLAPEHSQHDGGLVNIDTATFECYPDDPIDYAVMEKTSRACVVSLFAGWNDVGSRLSIWDVHAKDANGNVTKGDVLVHDSHSCLVHGNGKLVPVTGLEDIVVVETKDATMIAHEGRVQDVRHVVKDLDAQDRSEAQNHCEVYRPWGPYGSVNMGGRFQIKHIIVKPGARLSLRMRHHRTEHWIVISGTAQMTYGDEIFLFTESQSTYIPITSVHRLTNPSKIPLEIVGVQSGSYLGEDDIERLEDAYGYTAGPAPQVAAGNR